MLGLPIYQFLMANSCCASVLTLWIAVFFLIHYEVLTIPLSLAIAGLMSSLALMQSFSPMIILFRSLLAVPVVHSAWRAAALWKLNISPAFLFVTMGIDCAIQMLTLRSLSRENAPWTINIYRGLWLVKTIFSLFALDAVAVTLDQAQVDALRTVASRLLLFHVSAFGVGLIAVAVFAKDIEGIHFAILAMAAAALGLEPVILRCCYIFMLTSYSPALAMICALAFKNTALSRLLANVGFLALRFEPQRISRQSLFIVLSLPLLCWAQEIENLAESSAWRSESLVGFAQFRTFF